MLYFITLELPHASFNFDASHATLCRMQSLTRNVAVFCQIENEYGNIESSFGKGGKEYVKWAARMALNLGAGVPWVMCKQTDAPYDIVNWIPFIIKKICESCFPIVN